MALSKDQKQSVVNEVKDLLASSKLTVAAKYQGTAVKQFQALRRSAKDSNTQLKVIKNRLVIKAITSSDNLKNIDTSSLNGQLLYAFNAEDEVAPAQTLANFARKNPQIEFVGAITEDGQFIGPDDVKALASLPSKDQLRAQLVGTIAAPLSGFVNVLSGNVRGVLNVLNARSEAIK
jgi:large subunit ribosomal protein L10